MNIEPGGATGWPSPSPGVAKKELVFAQDLCYSMTVKVKPSEQLLRMVQTCGLTRAELSRRTGISEGVLSRFVNGETDLSLRNLDRLAGVLKLEITSRKDDKGG